jgi:hypothetical protein
MGEIQKVSKDLFARSAIVKDKSTLNEAFKDGKTVLVTPFTVMGNEHNPYEEGWTPYRVIMDKTHLVKSCDTQRPKSCMGWLLGPPKHGWRVPPWCHTP